MRVTFVLPFFFFFFFKSLTIRSFWREKQQSYRVHQAHNFQFDIYPHVVYTVRASLIILNKRLFFLFFFFVCHPYILLHNIFLYVFCLYSFSNVDKFFLAWAERRMWESRVFIKFLSIILLLFRISFEAEEYGKKEEGINRKKRF